MSIDMIKYMKFTITQLTIPGADDKKHFFLR